jgi:hypothetical protein
VVGRWGDGGAAAPSARARAVGQPQETAAATTVTQ